MSNPQRQQNRSLIAIAAAIFTAAGITGCRHDASTASTQSAVSASPGQAAGAATGQSADAMTVKTTADGQRVSAAGAVVAPEPGGPTGGNGR